MAEEVSPEEQQRFVDPLQLLLSPSEPSSALPCGCINGCVCFSMSPFSPAQNIQWPFSNTLDAATLSPARSRASSFGGLPPSPFVGHQGQQQVPIMRQPTLPFRTRTNLDNNPSLYDPNRVEQHLQQDAPFSLPSTGPPQILAQSFGEYTTPPTTVPSIAEGGLEISSPVHVSDFTGQNRIGVRLDHEIENWREARQLATRINNQGFRLHGSDEDGLPGAITALQKSMSFYLEDKVTPPTRSQLEHYLHNTRSAAEASERPEVVPQALEQLLALYGDSSGYQFNLGVVSKLDRAPNLYRARVYRMFLQENPTIWLFHDIFGEDPPNRVNYWAAIIPYANSSRPTYADALRANATTNTQVPTSRARAATTGTLNPQLLHPGRIPGQQLRQNNQRNFAQTGRVNRGGHRQPRTQDRNGHSISRPSPRGSRAPSRVQSRANSPVLSPAPSSPVATRAPRNAGRNSIGSDTGRPHACAKCGKMFAYPKDVRRHETTHTKEKKFACSLCPKRYTRPDNLSRHVRDDHPGHTPPMSAHE